MQTIEALFIALVILVICLMLNLAVLVTRRRSPRSDQTSKDICLFGGALILVWAAAHIAGAQRETVFGLIGLISGAGIVLCMWAEAARDAERRGAPRVASSAKEHSEWRRFVLHPGGTAGWEYRTSFTKPSDAMDGYNSLVEAGPWERRR